MRCGKAGRHAVVIDMANRSRDIYIGSANTPLALLELHPAPFVSPRTKPSSECVPRGKENNNGQIQQDGRGSSQAYP